MQHRNSFRRFEQKRYTHKTYQNPYFTRKRVSYRRPLWISGASLVFLIVFVCFLFSARAFRLTTVSVTGLHQSDKATFETHVREYLETRRALFFHNTNRFLFSKNALKHTLDSTYNFEEFTGSIKNNILELSVKERSSQFVWKTNGSSYLVDKNGVMIQQIPNTSPVTFPVFVDRNNIAVSIGGTVLTPEEISNIFAFQEGLKQMQIAFLETQVDRLAGKWIGILTKDGYTILFDATGDIGAQLHRLDVLKKGELKDKTKLQYIDLRFGDHVYYK